MIFNKIYFLFTIFNLLLIKNIKNNLVNIK